MAKDTLENAQKRAEYWKANSIAASKEIDAMKAVVKAARKINHYHYASYDGMIVSADCVRDLWQALEDYDETQKKEAS
jgi:hypothetical protein